MSKKPGFRTPGSFTMPNGMSAVGDLHVRGRKMDLILHGQQDFGRYSEPLLITGVLGDLRKVTCIRSVIGSTRRSIRTEEGGYHYAEVLPNFVIVGEHHLNPEQSCISSVQFATQDVGVLFHDYRAFGHLFLDAAEFDQIRQSNKFPKDAQLGEHPDLFYFSGKLEVIRVPTVLGLFRAYHRPKFMGNTVGDLVTNSMLMELAFEAPVSFDTCIARLLSLHRFLSLAAGRHQSLDAIRITLAGKDRTLPDGISIPTELDLYWKHAPKKSKGDTDTPSSYDLPLNPTRRPEEFKTVLSNWLEREPDWRQPRIRYTGCLEKARFYDIDRLVAAANMFDLLPTEAVILTSALSAQLEDARKQCKAIFRNLPDSPERSSVLGALGRMDKPSLTKKVLYRVNMVVENTGNLFPSLARAATIAVKVRNHFVHGTSGDIDYARLERLMPFLTETLEFVFAASDLIEAGWDAKVWAAAPHSAGHSFASFRWGYKDLSRALEAALS